MATLAALKKKLAALEAQVEQVTKTEMGAALAKVRKIMSDFGITLEHLADTKSTSKVAAKKRAAAKTPKTAAAKKGKVGKQPKYQDPASGVTWSGVGRAPGWIANAASRDDFLISKPDASSATSTKSKPVKKRAASAKRAKPAAASKKVARGAVASKKTSSSGGKVAVAKKAATKVAKKVAKKPAAKAAAKAPRKRAVSKPVDQAGTDAAAAAGN